MYSIALNTFREIIRSRAFAFIGILAVFTTTLTILAEALSLGEAPLIIPDFCLFFLEISGLMTIIILGNRMISREYEERTIYLTLSRPIRRSAIFFGKYLGFLGIL